MTDIDDKIRKVASARLELAAARVRFVACPPKARELVLAELTDKEVACHRLRAQAEGRGHEALAKAYEENCAAFEAAGEVLEMLLPPQDQPALPPPAPPPPAEEPESLGAEEPQSAD